MKSIERVMLGLAVISTIALMLLISVAVIARGVFNYAVPDVVVIVRELMIPTIMLPLAAATAARAHVAVTFVTDRMSPRWRGRLIVFGWAVALLAITPIIYAAGRDFLNTYSSGEFYDGQLGLPRWPMRLVFTLGLIAMWLRLARVAADDIAELRETGTVSGTEHSSAEAV